MKQPTVKNKIELISVDVLDQYRRLVEELKELNATLALSSGWHYLMDWTWIVSQIDQIRGKTILDAGAGIGLLQWYLALHGAQVISVDRSDRTCIPFHLLECFNVKGLREKDRPLNLNEILNIQNRKSGLTKKIKSLMRGAIGAVRSRKLIKSNSTGSVTMYNQDMKLLASIPSNSVDLVISISALEHNENIESIKEIIEELKRVLKPGGLMIVTLPAALEKDWFFKPAYSWCFSEATLKYLFQFPDNVDSNFDQYDLLFSMLNKSDELRRNLSARYYYLPNTGMPWGIWKPQYLPVGIVKTKM